MHVTDKFGRKCYTHIDTKTVNQAIEDRINDNRPLTSRAYIQRRISEIIYDRSETSRVFKDFVNHKISVVKGSNILTVLPQSKFCVCGTRMTHWWSTDTDSFQYFCRVRRWWNFWRHREAKN